MQQLNTKLHKKEIKILPILVIFTVIALIVSAILAIITPKPDSIIQSDFVSTNYNDSQSTFKKINFTGQEPILPEQFNIYQAVSTVSLASNLANEIIDEYHLEQRSDLENYWQKDAYLLIDNSYDERYSFDLATNEATSEATIDSNQAVALCFDFFAKYKLDLNLAAQEDNFVYLRGNLEQSETSVEQANFIQIPLTYELDGYPVFYQSESNYPFFCKINNNEQLQRVTFKKAFYKFENIKTMPSISLNQAIKNIKNGKVSITQASSQIVDSVNLDWIAEADLYSVAIDYRFDESLKVAYPFFKFKGTLTNAAGVNIQATLITPAVATAEEE